MDELLIRPWRFGDALPSEAVQWVHTSELWFAEHEGKYAGIAAARQISEGEFELLYIETAPGLRQSGIGTALLRSLLDRYPGLWFLEVRESNRAGRRLYEKLGFELRGRRTRYYSMPDEDALVMARTLPMQNGAPSFAE